MRTILRAGLLAALATLPAMAQPAAQAPAVDVTIDTNAPGAMIDRHIYGQFAEHLGRGIYEGIWVGPNSKIPNIKGYRKDVVAALKAIHVPVVRWPGGCFADNYDWRDGIGPRAKRPTRINVNWGDVTEDNSFGTNEYMDLMELLGSDAYLSVNVGSMTPLDAQRWIEYVTSDQKATLANERRKNGREKPWNLKYIGIGNETWGCGGNMSASVAASNNARFSGYIRTPAAMGTVKVASGASGNGGDDTAFAETLLKEGGRIQALSYHYYAMPSARGPKGPATGFGENLWAQELSLAVKLEDLVAKQIAVMDKVDPQKRIALYVDEWGSWYDQEPGSHPGFLYQQNSIRDAEVAALSLNIFHRHTDRVKLAAIAQMVNVLQAMILTDKEKMVLTPTYHVFDMYQPFMEATPYKATVSAANYTFGDNKLPLIDVSAARGKDGKMYLAIVNTDPHRAVTVRTGLSGTATGRILAGATMDAHNSFDNPNAVHPVAFSGASEDGKLVFHMPAMAVAVVAVN